MKRMLNAASLVAGLSVFLLPVSSFAGSDTTSTTNTNNSKCDSSTESNPTGTGIGKGISTDNSGTTDTGIGKGNPTPGSVLPNNPTDTKGKPTDCQ